jgi:hypothetical protein
MIKTIREDLPPCNSNGKALQKALMEARLHFGLTRDRSGREQYFRLLRQVNRARKLAGLEILPPQVLPLRRRPARPFA